MRRRSESIASTMMPALLLGSLLALVAAIWATLPDAWLTQGMFRLAALRALPLFNLAAIALTALALAVRFLGLAAPTATALPALLLGVS